MKRIIVDDKHKEKIDAVINEVQQNSKTRKINATDITLATKLIEEKTGLTRRELDGCAFWVDVWAKEYARAYKYTPQSTQFYLECDKGKWYVSEIGRRDQVACGYLSGVHVRCAKMTENAENLIMRRFRNFCIF